MYQYWGKYYFIAGCGAGIPVHRMWYVCSLLFRSGYFLVDEDMGDGFASVTLPYEFLPLPQKSNKGKGLDRSGKEVCDAEVVQVRSAKSFDHTNLLTIKVPKEMAMTVRFFRSI